MTISNARISCAFSSVPPDTDMFVEHDAARRTKTPLKRRRGATFVSRSVVGDTNVAERLYAKVSKKAAIVVAVHSLRCCRRYCTVPANNYAANKLIFSFKVHDVAVRSIKADLTKLLSSRALVARDR